MAGGIQYEMSIIMSAEAPFVKYIQLIEACHRLHVLAGQDPPNVQRGIKLEEVSVSDSPFEQHEGTPWETDTKTEYIDTPFTFFRPREDVIGSIEQHFGPDKSKLIVGDINKAYPVQHFEYELPVDGVLRILSNYIE